MHVLNRFSIGARLLTLLAIMAVSAVTSVSVPLYALSALAGNFKWTQENAAAPSRMVAAVRASIRDNKAAVLEAIAAYTQANKDFPKVRADAGARLKRNTAIIEKNWAAYRATQLTADAKEQADRFEPEYRNFESSLKAAVDAIDAQKFDAAYTAAQHPSYDTALNLTGKLQDIQLALGQSHVEATVSTARQASWAIGIATAAALVILIALALAILRSITVPVRQVAETIKQVERDANLGLRVPVLGSDELAQTAQAINSLLQAFDTSVHEVQGAAARVSDAAGAIAASAARLSDQSSSQSNEAASMAAAVEELTVSIAHVSDSAQDAKGVSSESGRLSEEGSAVIREAVTEMGVIAESVRTSSASVDSLGKESEKVSAIVAVIKEIADQTNLLALNAAIEAARAGEQGRGFAVVADEVRRLAERTAGSTQEIAAMINAMQSGVRNATGSMESGVAKVDRGLALANKAGDSIERINAGTLQVVKAVNDISSALSEQSAAANDIAKRVELIAQMSEANSAHVRQSVETADFMAELSRSLNASLGRFRVGAQAK